jgi:Protein of unknown function (DUF2501)
MRVPSLLSRLATVGLAAAAILALAPLAATPARAQLMDQLKGAVQGGNGGGNAGAGGLMGGLPSVAQASPSNTAGVLQYCMRNNYLSGSAASSLKDSLLGKANSSGQHADDAGFKAGNNGLLETGNGQNFSLSGSGIKQQVTHKICDMVLQHAKSLL